MNQLIQENSAPHSATTGLRAKQTQSGHSPSGEMETSRTLPGCELGSTGFPLDSVICLNLIG